MKKVLSLMLLIIVGSLLPAEALIPVANATKHDWNPYSYWASPWGASGVHKGIDIFAQKGTTALASTGGIVLFSGHLKRGGNAVLVLGPKWRLHYYAHLQNTDVSILSWVGKGETIGTVGNTGNAAGKPAHLHYSVLRLLPNPVDITLEPQGWKRMFFINPAVTFSQG